MASSRKPIRIRTPASRSAASVSSSGKPKVRSPRVRILPLSSRLPNAPVEAIPLFRFRAQPGSYSFKQAARWKYFDGTVSIHPHLVLYDGSRVPRFTLQ